MRSILTTLRSRFRRSLRLKRALGYEETIWTRKVSDEETRKLVRELDPPALSALEISGRVWETFGFGRYRSVHYPEFDLCHDALDEQFDLAIAEHIFEHLPWPRRAADNARRMLKANGHLLVVTPFLYRVHACPNDFTRWTEDGLRYLLADAGFPLDRVRTGSWGNRAVIEATFRKEFRLFNRHRHSLENDPDLPIVVWALAERGE